MTTTNFMRAGNDDKYLMLHELKTEQTWMVERIGVKGHGKPETREEMSYARGEEEPI